MLEDDGIIDDDERKILERKRTKYNITKERGIELENENIGKFNFLNLTTEEKEYIEEIKFFLEDDNEISEIERRMLDRLKVKLKISNERAFELESIIIK